MSPHPVRILIVDDEPDTCANLSDILTDLGYQVDLDAADPYTLPDEQVALQGEPVIHTAPIDRGVMQPVDRMVLPDE